VDTASRMLGFDVK